MYRWVAVPPVPDAELAGLGLDQTWPDQAAAEEWLTGAYPDLLASGVTAVSLLEEDRPIYGPMSLEA